MPVDLEEIETDVLVVGGGVSGLQSAVEALNRDVDVTIISKGPIGRSGSSSYADVLCEFTAFAAAVGEGDSVELHVADLLNAGCGMNDRKLVEIFARESVEWLHRLEEKGVRFQKNRDGSYRVYQISGHSVARACTSEHGLAGEILETLMREAESLGLEKREKTILLEITTADNNQVNGAFALDLNKLKLLFFRCPSVILATGGVGQLFKLSTNPIDITGDGIALAYNAGAALTNLEFIQPLPLVINPIKGYFIISSVLMHGELYDREHVKIPVQRQPAASPGKLAMQFMEQICLVHAQKTQEGKTTKNGGIYWRLSRDSRNKLNLHNVIPRTLERFARVGVDLEEDFIELAPGEHEFIGGVMVDENAQSTVKGLYYPGEGGAGIQGAYRITGSTFPQAIVFGARAGRHAAEQAKTRKAVREIQDAQRYWRILGYVDGREGDVSPRQVRKELQETMTSILVLKNEATLSNALKMLSMLERLLNRCSVEGATREQRINNLLHLMENKNAITVAELIVEAMLKRKESRGYHKRTDYPEESPTYASPQIFYKQQNDFADILNV